MNIYQVRDNLKNTIAGKELLYKEYIESDNVELKAIASYIRVNLTELNAILADVEQCCEQYTLSCVNYETKNTNKSSWKGAVDKQSGAFTQDEIDNATAWR
jgi:hypothetical protein